MPKFYVQAIVRIGVTATVEAEDEDQAMALACEQWGADYDLEDDPEDVEAEEIEE